MNQILNYNLAHGMEKIKQIVKIRFYMYNMRFIARSILGCLSQALCFLTFGFIAHMLLLIAHVLPLSAHCS